MNKKIISIILLGATVASVIPTTTVKAQVRNDKATITHELNNRASIFDNTIYIHTMDFDGDAFIPFSFIEENGKLFLTTVSNINYKLSDSITVRFLTQGGSVEIERTFEVGTSLNKFKDAIKKVDLKYGDSIQLIPRYKTNLIRIFGHLNNTIDNYNYTTGMSRELAETRAFKLTHDGIVVNRYYPI